MLKIKDMSIIITGGCSGLGLGMAKRYSEAGAKVTICGRRREKVQKAQEELESFSTFPVSYTHLTLPTNREV